MKYFNLHTAQYSVSGLRDFTINEALRFWKAKFETIKHLERDLITHPGLEALGKYIREQWNSIQPVTVQEALQEQNMERRRVMFDCIGVAKLFKELEPELLDRQIIQKMRTRWHRDYTPYDYQFEDTYELYRLEGEKLFIAPVSGNKPNPVYAVRCWCTTTGREYWIYVPRTAAIGVPAWQETGLKPDAVRAIAWTIRLDVSKPKRIFRQGDIIVVEESEESTTVAPYHLSKEQYLQLMFSET